MTMSGRHQAKPWLRVVSGVIGLVVPVVGLVWRTPSWLPVYAPGMWHRVGPVQPLPDWRLAIERGTGARQARREVAPRQLTKRYH